MNATADRPGHQFQNFVAMLERMFAHRDGVKVDSPLRLRDKDTGRLREHDVVITRITHHGPSLTALECKDHGRKIGVTEVEAFSKKCEKTGIHRGIIVSASGFADTARTKAKALNITLMSLTDAETFEWIGDVVIMGRVHNYKRIDLYVRLADTGKPVANPFTVYDMDDQPYTGEGAQSLLMRGLPPEATEPPYPRIGSLTTDADQFYVIDANGDRFPVIDITFSYELEVEHHEHPVTLHNYEGEDSAMQIATGEITFPGGSAVLTLVKHKDGEVSGAVVTKGTDDHSVQIGDSPRRFPD